MLLLISDLLSIHSRLLENVPSTPSTPSINGIIVIYTFPRFFSSSLVRSRNLQSCFVLLFSMATGRVKSIIIIIIISVIIIIIH